MRESTRLFSSFPITDSAHFAEGSISTPGFTTTAIWRSRTVRETALSSAAVDWSRTKAYALGLAGMYLNLRGRESQGTVEPGAEAETLKRELIRSLSALRDGDTIPIGNVYATESLYKGPYLGAAPDLIVGYNEGYRVSWEAAVGRITLSVIEDNAKAWSGDHCVDPVLVPGVLFANRSIAAANPRN